MGKCFNVDGICYPDENYMVNLESRLKEIQMLVDNKKYFIINRARQYGKTTTLWALRKYLEETYAILLVSFQGLSTEDFTNEAAFSSSFADLLIQTIHANKKGLQCLKKEDVSMLAQVANNPHHAGLRSLFHALKMLCFSSLKPVVLMIDEVDHASNNQVFLDFLGRLRYFYLNRKENPTFQSVILAGVYDIKNLKQKLRPKEEHRYNSPWNIAAKFTVDMSFSVQDIIGMLEDYEQEQRTGMDVYQIADLIYDYTSGYPFLVSYICKMLDEQIPSNNRFTDKAAAWTEEGIFEAVKEMMKESSTLFDDMRKKLDDYPKLHDMLYAILFNGKSFPYNPDNYAIDIGTMFGFVKEKDGMVAISNRIFETRLYNLFLSEEILDSEIYQSALLDKNQFVNHGVLNVELVLQKFVEHFTDLYGSCEETFLEDVGRRYFLLYLKPIINGTGNYYIEAQTRDMRRTDVIIDYRGKQYIIEMKIWRGEEYNRRGQEQLVGYLDDYHLKKGYMLSFNFHKNKKIGIKTIKFGDKTLIEATV